MENTFDIDVPEVQEEIQTPVKPTPAAPQTVNAGVDLPDLDIAVRSEGPSHVVEPDLKKVAVKFAVIGAGQGGSRLADAFYQIGYRRVCAVNTTAQDFLGLSIPTERQMVIPSDGGAGKDPDKGEDNFMDASEDIMNFMRRSFGDDIDHIVICIGAGGGTGSGAAMVLYKLAKNYLAQLGKDQKVGMIVTMPKHSEGGRVQANALSVLEKMIPLGESKSLSPLVIVDNQAIHQMFPQVSAKQFWVTANKNAVGLFDIFNVLANQQSAYTTFDRADYRSVLDSGIIIFGATKLTSFARDTDISDGLRNNLKKTLLSDGFDLTTATHSAAVLAAPDAILSVLPQSYIDLAFETLERTLGGQNKPLMLHQGVYEASRNGLFLYTMVGGLKFPQKRLDLIKARSGV